MKGGFDFMGMVPLVLIFVVMYFLIIRPQNKKAKQHREMLSSLGKGVRVLMNGGLIGVIKESGDQELTLEISKGVEVQAARSMVAGLAEEASVSKTTSIKADSALAKKEKSLKKTR